MVFINAFCSGIILSGSITFATDQYGDFFYVSNGMQITITGYDGEGGNVLIPSSILDLPVTGIGAYTFYYQNSLTRVSIPDGVVTIGESAFSGCGGLTKITIIGTPDIPISIETSETLPGDSWQPLHVGTLSKGNLEFTHPDAIERPVRYYRITAP